MTLKGKKPSFHQLGHLFNEPNLLTARVALFSFVDFSTSKLYEMILLVMEYTQIIVPTLLFSLSFHDSTTAKTIHDTVRVIHPCYWIPLERIDAPAIFVLTVVNFLILGKLMLFGYVNYLAFNRKEGHKLLIKTWRHVFKLQGRYVGFFLMSFWIKAFVKINEEDENGNKILMIIGSLAIAFEGLFSLFLTLQYCYILPTKSFLASKDNILEIISFVQKCILGVLVNTLSRDLLGNSRIVAFVNLSIDVIRVVYFFRRLPLYKFRALDFQGNIFMVMTSLNISIIVADLYDSQDAGLLMILWVITSFLLVRVSKNYLKKRFWDLLTDTRMKSPHLLLHRICAIKELQKLVLDATNHPWGGLLSEVLNQNLVRIMDIGSDFPQELPLNITNSKNTVLKYYLGKLLKKHPKNKFVQIFKANFDVKTLHKYGDAIVTSQKLRKEYFSQTCLSASVLLLKIQHTIKDYYSQNTELNLWRYFHEKALMEQMKSQMMEQALLQTKICKEIKQNSPDLGVLFNDSQQVNFYRKKVAQKAQEIFSNASDSYIEPVLLYAGYHLALNHSIEDYLHYQKIYSQKTQKYQKHFNQETLDEENFSQGNIGYFLVSGNDTVPGLVVHASRVLGDYFSSDPALYSGRPLHTFGPPCFKELYHKVYEDREEKGPHSLIGKLNRGFSYKLDGYMVNTTWVLDIFPAVTQACYWTLIIRPTNTTKDFLWVFENGDLDCGTKDLTERLCLPRNFASRSGRANLRELNEELGMVSEAFNMIAFPDKERKSLLSMERAKEIYDVYTTTGKDLYLSKIQGDDAGKTKFLYNCKMVNNIFGPDLLKLMTFEKVKESQKAEFPRVRKYSAEAKQEEDVTYFETEGEQNLGWIDCNAIKTKAGYLSPSPREIVQESAQIPFETQMNSNRPLVTRVSTTENLRKSSGAESHEILVSQSDRNDTRRFTGKKEDLRVGSNSKHKKLSSLYQKSLQEASYPKLMRMFFGMFFGIFVVLSVCQFLLKITIDSNVETLQNKMDAVRGAEVQNAALLSAQSVTRILSDYRTGILTNANTPTFGPKFEPFSYYLSLNIEQLAEFNHYLFSNASYLASDLRDLIFNPLWTEYISEIDYGVKKDVKLYKTEIYSDNYSTVDIFQATYIVIEILSEVLTIDDPNSPDAIENVNFVMINSLNDIFIKNQEISQLMLESLDRQNLEVEENIKLNVIILSSLLLISFVCGFGIILNQYHKLIKNLHAVCRINETKLEDVICNFEDFQKVLVDDSSLQISFFQKKLLVPRSQGATVKKIQAKSPNSLKITKNYLFITGCLAILGSITFGLVFGTAMFYQKCLNTMQQQKDWIYFADSISTKAILTWTSARELLDTNNTAIIDYKSVSVKLQEMLEALVDIRTQAYEINFDNIREESKEQVQGLLFGNACEFIENTVFAPQCQALESLGQKGNLVDTSNIFENIIRARIEDYQYSDKSAAALRNIELGDFAFASLNFLILRGISMSLASLLDGDYEEEVSHTKFVGKVALIMFILWEVMMCWIFWKWVYAKLSEGVNEFKNILKIFPAETVLSNFILKMFLMKTSMVNKNFEINER